MHCEGIFGYTAYSSTKFALRGLAESLAMELQPHGISVTLSLPPDTDTPGFAIEEQSKPMETKAISQVATLVQPEVVAEKTFEDALVSMKINLKLFLNLFWLALLNDNVFQARNFFSAVGLEGFIMTTLCAGMSPVPLFRHLLLQVLLMGLLRLIGAIYLFIFQLMIVKCNKNSTNSEALKKVK